MVLLSEILIPLIITILILAIFWASVRTAFRRGKEEGKKEFDSLLEEKDRLMDRAFSGWLKSLANRRDLEKEIKQLEEEAVILRQANEDIAQDYYDRGKLDAIKGMGIELFNENHTKLEIQEEETPEFFALPDDIAIMIDEGICTEEEAREAI